MLAKQSYDYQETYKHCESEDKIIPIYVMFTANLLADSVSSCFKTKRM